MLKEKLDKAAQDLLSLKVVTCGYLGQFQANSFSISERYQHNTTCLPRYFEKDNKYIHWNRRRNGISGACCRVIALSRSWSTALPCLFSSLQPPAVICVGDQPHFQHIFSLPCHAHFDMVALPVSTARLGLAFYIFPSLFRTLI